jgi:hypothetical protein
MKENINLDFRTSVKLAPKRINLRTEKDEFLSSKNRFDQKIKKKIFSKKLSQSPIKTKGLPKKSHPSLIIHIKVCVRCMNEKHQQNHN